MAWQGLQKRGSYGRRGIGSGCGRFSSACTAIRGVHRMPSGITIRAASIRELGHAFHAHRSPSIASSSLKSIPSLFIQITLDLTTITDALFSSYSSRTLPPTDFIGFTTPAFCSITVQSFAKLLPPPSLDLFSLFVEFKMMMTGR